MSKLHFTAGGLHISHRAFISKVRQQHNCEHQIIAVPSHLQPCGKQSGTSGSERALLLPSPKG